LLRGVLKGKSMKANEESGLEGRWKALGPAKEICKTKVLSLSSRPWRCLRSGAEGDFIRIGIRDWVNAIASTSSGEIVMIRQFRHGSERTELEIPGGCIESEDASPIEAAARELLEETGYSGECGRVIACVSPNPALQFNRCFTVAFDNARKLSDTKLEDGEEIETLLVPSSKLLSMVKDGSISHGLVLNAMMFHFIEKGLLKERN